MTIPHLRPDPRGAGATARPPHTLVTPPDDAPLDAGTVLLRARSALVIARLCVDELRTTRESVQLFGTRRPVS